MKVQTFAILVCAFFALVGCQTTTRPPDVVTVSKFRAYECGTPPAIDVFVPLTVTWRLVQGPGGDFLFTLTAQDYENLGMNMASVLASARELQAQRNFYVACIARSKEADANGTEH